MPEIDLTEITIAREAAAAQADRLRQIDLELSAARSSREVALSRGDAQTALAATATVEEMAVQRGETVEAIRDALGTVGSLQDAMLVMRTPEEAVATLSGEHPVLLLPVRLETRFLDGTLRVRIFPDQAHVTAHDPAVTADEEAGLRWYWEHRWPDRSSDTLADEAWDVLSGRFRPGRAGFLVRTYPPQNLAAGGPAPQVGGDPPPCVGVERGRSGHPVAGPLVRPRVPAHRRGSAQRDLPGVG